jgi:hypothetical protein
MLCDGPGATRAIVAGGFTLVADVREHLVDVVGMRPDALTEAR